MPKIRVLQEHIDAATPKDSACCMIALAIREQLKATRVSVDLRLIRYTLPDKELRYEAHTPDHAADYLLAFDYGDAAYLKPFEFRLTPHQSHEAKRKDNRKDRTRVTTPRKGKRSVVKGGRARRTGALASGPAVRLGRRREFGRRAIAADRWSPPPESKPRSRSARSA